ncbi:MAG: SDR family NAD(P)-dependent oxidoreductase [Cyanobacteria bacterium P01_H01_bin.15]
MAQQLTALIVGGNGGIGYGFVQQLLSSGQFAQVFATYHRIEQAGPLLSLANEYSQLHCLPLDLTHESQIQGLVAQISGVSDHLDRVINTVGILQQGETLKPEKSLKHLSSVNLYRYFLTNSIGPILLLKHLLPLCKKSEKPILATLSAKVGSIGDNHLGGWYGYRASKAALNMLIRTAAIEYQRVCPQAIVVALHPGTTVSDLSKPFQGNVPPEKLFPVERTVCQLLSVIERLQLSDTGQFWNWDGGPLPW